MLLDNLTFGQFGYTTNSLSIYSNRLVYVLCDYCNKQFTKSYQKYNKSRKNILKDCCNNSIYKNIKRRESLIKLFGGPSSWCDPLIRAKIKPRLNRYRDLTNQKFARLRVIKFAHKKNRNIYWLCRCECGNEITCQSSHLLSKSIQSCGCLRQEMCALYSKKHGQHKTKTYHAWQSMLQRCYNKNHKSYHNYGGRGITVCKSWRESFLNFLKDMKEKPSGLSLDRVNNNGNYEPNNCCWSTPKRQAQNRNTNILITYNNETKCLMEWAELLNIPYSTLSNRLNRGWTHYDTLSRPIDASRRHK